MKFIKNIIQRWISIKDEKKVLGRWNIETCDKKTNYKIDFANEDHCGPCGYKGISMVGQMTTNIKIDLNLPKYHREY